MLIEGLAIALAAKLAAAPASFHPKATTIESSPVTCVALTKHDLQSRRFHAFVCVDVVNTGDVTGAVLRPNGSIFCDLDGTYDGQCLNLTGCGGTSQSCL